MGGVHRAHLSLAALLLLLPLLAIPPATASATPPGACRILERTQVPLSPVIRQALELRCSGELERLAAARSGDERPARTSTSSPSAAGELRQPDGVSWPSVRVNDPTDDDTKGDGTNITQLGPDVVIDGQRAVAAFTDSTDFQPPDFSGTGTAVSYDGGRTWTDVGPVPTGNGFVLGDPSLHLGPPGSDQVFMANAFCNNIGGDFRCPIGFSTITFEQEGILIGNPIPIDPSIPPQDFAGFPDLTLDPASGLAYAAWTQLDGDTGDALIKGAFSEDGGQTWSPPVTASDPTCAPGAGFPHNSVGSEVVVLPNGDIYMAWECFGDGGPQIRGTLSMDGGETFEPNWVINEFEHSGRLTQCNGFQDFTVPGDIRTDDTPSIAANPDTGGIFLTHSGAGPDGDPSDVFLFESTDGGETWSPIEIAIPGLSPTQFHPSVGVDPITGDTVVTRFETTDDDGLEEVPIEIVSLDLTGTSEAVPLGPPFLAPATNPQFDSNLGPCGWGGPPGVAPLQLWTGGDGEGGGYRPIRAPQKEPGGFLVAWTDNRDPGPAENNGVDPNIYSAVVGFCPGAPENGTHILGTALDDTLNGTADRDRMCGFDGDDTLRGKAGNDRIDGGPGDDASTLIGAGGADEILGRGGDDRLKGGPGDDILKAGSGNDVSIGGGGRDRIRSGAGADILRGGGQADTLAGGAGRDILRGGRGDDKLKGGAGRDRLISGPGDDILVGGPGFDVCKGGGGNDRFRGCERIL